MKLSCYFCALVLTLAPLAASATPKRMGPSAIEAARLKKYPPPNYLAHYLPDDRYKIAGKVWKYVSTDLDTYYHVPASPNMMRQPANRVIGFANAKDAEEAGYIADPTDGTSSQVASVSLPTGSKGISTQGLTKAEAIYIVRIYTIQSQLLGTMGTALKQIEKLKDTHPVGEPAAWGVINTYRAFGTRNLAAVQRSWSAFNRVTPPSRFKQAHAYFRASMNQALNSATYLSQGFQSTDATFLDRFVNAFNLYMSYDTKGEQALKAARG